MGRVVKPIVVVEVILLAVAFAAGLTVIIPLLETENQLPKAKCLPYTQIQYNPNPPYSWHRILIVLPDSNGTCDYCLFSQITVVVAALASILYRLVTLFAERFDLSFLRTMSVPLYTLLTLAVLVEGIILQVGVNRFLGTLLEYETYSDPHTCDFIQAKFEHLSKIASVDLSLNFCSELNMVTVASWISAVSWLILTILAGVQFHLQRYAPLASDRQMLVYGAGDEEKK